MVALGLFATTATQASANERVSVGAGGAVTLAPAVRVCEPSCSGPENFGLKVSTDFVNSKRVVIVEQLSFGDPQIDGGSAGCQTEFLRNRVVCGLPQGLSSVSITTADGADNVQFVAAAPGNVECVKGARPSIPVSVTLGPGNDHFSVPDSEPCAPGLVPVHAGLPEAMDPVLTVDGGAGRDDIRGGVRADTLSGGPESDLVLGEEGNDTLDGGAGIDEVEGGPGADTITASGGADLLHGNGGNDSLTGSSGARLFGDSGDDYFNENAANPPQQISGGEGFDTVDFSGRQGPEVITVADPTEGDGEGPHEGNNITDAERILGGKGLDIIVGSSEDNVLVGNGGDDLIVAGSGTDTLQGGPGEDTLVSKDEFHGDHFEGGPDNDRILANNGAPDIVSCGEGSDSAEVDLKDILVLHVVKFGTAALQLPDCEAITKGPVDDSPPGRPKGRTIRLLRHAAALDFRCPGSALPSCSGQLLVQDARRGGKVLGHVNYALGLGQVRTLRVHLTRRARATLLRERRTIVRTVEQGHSKIGPRGAEFVMRVSVR